MRPRFPAKPRRRRRFPAWPLVALALFSVGSAVAACGSSQVEPQGDPVRGQNLIEQVTPSCGACHTLAAAEFEGTIGPDLDLTTPGYEAVFNAITDGPGTMPSYRDRLSVSERHDVAAFVSHHAGEEEEAEEFEADPEAVE